MAEQLHKAILRDLDRKVDLTVCFNPKELTVEKQVQWTQKEGAINDEPPEEFSKPTPASLTVTLHFDTYEDKVSVCEAYTDKLEKMAMIMCDSAERRRPPLCLFVWGPKFRFQGVIESLSQKFTMFLCDGTPVRCEATIKMKKACSAEVAKKGGTGNKGGGK